MTEEARQLRFIREKTIEFIRMMFIDSERPRDRRRTEWQNPAQVGLGAMEVLKDICNSLDRIDPRPGGGSWYDQSHLLTHAEARKARKSA